jgi:hypothetical protein
MVPLRMTVSKACIDVSRWPDGPTQNGREPRASREPLEAFAPRYMRSQQWPRASLPEPRPHGVAGRNPARPRIQLTVLENIPNISSFLPI